MFVRIEYLHQGLQSGLTTSAIGRNQLLRRLKEIGVDLETVTKFETDKGQGWKEFDPELLKGE